MSRILKYPLSMHGSTHLSLPASIKPIHVAMQFETPCLWAEESGGVCELVDIIAVPTGGEVPAGGRYLGTVQAAGGRYVIHFYMVIA